MNVLSEFDKSTAEAVEIPGDVCLTYMKHFSNSSEAATDLLKKNYSGIHSNVVLPLHIVYAVTRPMCVVSMGLCRWIHGCSKKMVEVLNTWPPLIFFHQLKLRATSSRLHSL